MSANFLDTDQLPTPATGGNLVVAPLRITKHRIPHRTVDFLPPMMCTILGTMDVCRNMWVLDGLVPHPGRAPSGKL